VFKTALAQLRIAASVGLGKPFAQWSLEHLIDATKETKLEFGSIGAEEGASHLGGPVFDEETRRELHLRRFRTQAARVAAAGTGSTRRPRPASVIAWTYAISTVRVC
jgi:hypothetical protein